MTQEEKTKIEEEIVDVFKDRLRPRNTCKHIRPRYDLQDRFAGRRNIGNGYDFHFAILSCSRLYLRGRKNKGRGCERCKSC